jgi:hypothetical protein
MSGPTYIERYVRGSSKDGLFPITDKSTKQKLSLKLEKVHRERLAQAATSSSLTLEVARAFGVWVGCSGCSAPQAAPAPQPTANAAPTASARKR